jgi:Flp pilus assembly protein TadG
MVETALAMPIILMVLTGIFFFSMAIYQKLALAEAVSVGGRFLSVDRGDTNPCSSATSKIVAAAPGLTASSMSFTYTLNGVATSGTSCPGSAGAANANMVAGGNAQIYVTYPCVLRYYPAFGNSFAGSCTLHAGVVEVVQ